MLYEITESEITYAFPFEMVASLRAYFQLKRISIDPIARWYSKLDAKEKEKVITSNLKAEVAG